MWNLETIQINLYTKQKQTHRKRNQTYGYQRGMGRKEVNYECGISRYKLIYIYIYLYNIYKQ